MHFVSFVLPPLLGYFVTAVLTVTARTHIFRVVIWPIVTSLALRAAVSVDLSTGESNRKLRNVMFATSIIFMTMRTFEWTLTKEPFRRHLHPAKDFRSTIMNTLELATTLRGCGWDWSHGVYIPPETRPASRRGFVFHVILSAVFHAIIWGIFHSAIRSFSPIELGTLSGGSIFDETLPFHLRYLRSSVISALALVVVYAGIQTSYDALTVAGVLVFRQEPAQWPPAFDAPWRATSMIDFWGRRWHQFMRRTFIVLGGYPFSFFLGKAGFVIGSFLASGFLHNAQLYLLDGKPEAWRLLVGFGQMGLVVLVERAFKQVTGRKVGGVVGWVWTAVWLLIGGNLIIDGLTRGGAVGEFVVVESVLPVGVREVVQRLVRDFDGWLHAI